MTADPQCTRRMIQFTVTALSLVSAILSLSPAAVSAQIPERTIEVLPAPVVVPDTALHLRVRTYALQPMAGRLLVTFSINGGALSIDTVQHGPLKREYRLRVNVKAVRQEDGSTVQLDSMQVYPIVAKGKPLMNSLRGPFGGVVVYRYNGEIGRLDGAAELVVPPGHYSLTLTLTQPPTKRFKPLELPIVIVPAAKEGTLLASDLVLGWEGNGYQWQAPGRVVPLNPYGVWQTDAQMSLFLQVEGLAPNADYQVTIDLFILNPPLTRATKSLTLNFNETPDGISAEWYRAILMQSLKPAPYCVRVIIRQGDKILTRVDRIRVVQSQWGSDAPALPAGACDTLGA